MTKTHYTQYNTKERMYCDEDGYLAELDKAYLFDGDELALAEDSLDCFDEPEEWKVIGVKVSYETFEIGGN